MVLLMVVLSAPSGSRDDKALATIMVTRAIVAGEDSMEVPRKKYRTRRGGWWWQ